MKRAGRIGLGILAMGVFLGQGAPVTGPTAPPVAGPLKRIEEAVWSETTPSAPIKLFTLRNSKGMTARVTNFGACIVGLTAPDRNGTFANVIAGADQWTAFSRYGMQAQTIGPVAGRIAGAKFTVDGKEYSTQANNGRNTLHSGNANFGTKTWTAKVLDEKPGEASVQFTIVTRDGDGGFPGPLTVLVTFTLNDNNELRLDYQATTEVATPLNLTNHAYFNLNGIAPGAGGRGRGTAPVTSITNHEIWIDADQYALTDSGLVPTGKLAPVKDTPLDFTKATLIGARLGALAPMNTYDHCFALNNGTRTPRQVALVARAIEPASGRVLEVRTDQPTLQLYTSNPPHPAFCFEAQGFPDAVHHPEFPSTILRPGETFKSTTIYAFSAK